MGATYLTDLDAVLRGAGLDVIPIDDQWQRRARSSGGYDGAPWCVMWHHTASGGDGASDAHYCTYSSDSAPVCNLVIDRVGQVWLCAGGATNCNGKGGPYTLPDGRTVPLDSMNTKAVAIELSNNGVGMNYPQDQIDACFAASNAIGAAYIGRVDNALGHVDWTSRKIDPATAEAVEGLWLPSPINSSGSWLVDDLRSECLARATVTPPHPPTPEGDDMRLLLFRSDDRVAWVVRPDYSFRSPITEAQVGLAVDMPDTYNPDEQYMSPEQLNAIPTLPYAGAWPWPWVS